MRYKPFFVAFRATSCFSIPAPFRLQFRCMPVCRLPLHPHIIAHLQMARSFSGARPCFSKQESGASGKMELLVALRRMAAGKAFGMVLAGLLLYAWYLGYSDDKSTKDRLKSGFCPPPESVTFVRRPQLERDLRSMLTPLDSAKAATTYYIITGENGTGKTTAVQQVCRQIGSGVIYVNLAPHTVSLYDALAEATAFMPREMGLITFLNHKIFGTLIGSKSESKIMFA